MVAEDDFDDDFDFDDDDDFNLDNLGEDKSEGEIEPIDDDNKEGGFYFTSLDDNIDKEKERLVEA